MITGMLGIVFFQQALTNPGTLPSTADTGLKIATSAGTVIGQLALAGLPMLWAASACTDWS
jgi:PHS family inorganic phosphate transporter-like MFS transporter